MRDERPVSLRELVIGTSLASLLAPLNSSMIAVALPDIRGDFHAGVGALTWLVSCYLIAVAVAQPVSGRLGDSFGHIRVTVVGLIALVAFSIVAGVAPDFTLLVAARTLQGIAAALIMPNAVAYLRKRVEHDELGRALGINASAVSTGAALGPIVGGLLVVLGGWRWLFFANIPFALAALALILSLPRDTGAGRAGLRIDAVSLASLAAAFTGMALLGTASRLGSSVLIVAAFAVLPVSMAAYWLRYRARGTGVADLRLFTRRNYWAPAAAVALGNLVMYTALIAIPVYLGDVRHLSDFTIGLVLFAMSAAMVAASPFGGRMADRLGCRLPASSGAVFVLLGAALLSAVLFDLPVIVLAIPLILVGVGIGMAQPPQQTAALRAWPAAVAGSASGTLSMMRYVGSVTGTALIAAVLAQHPGASDFRMLFAITVIPAGIGVAAALAILDRTTERAEEMAPEGFALAEGVPKPS